MRACLRVTDLFISPEDIVKYSLKKKQKSKQNVYSNYNYPYISILSPEVKEGIVPEIDSQENKIYGYQKGKEGRDDLAVWN